MNNIELDGYRPGCLAGMISLHMRYYGPEWGFGAGFEAKLAAESGVFLADFDVGRDFILSAWSREELLGTVFVDGSGRDGPGNHLRWFIVSEAARGSGLGRQMMERAMAFCDASAQDLTWLTTFAGLEAAAALYRRAGFTMINEEAEDQWQAGVREQRYERMKQT